jgi:hypothetical protein
VLLIVALAALQHCCPTIMTIIYGWRRTFIWPLSDSQQVDRICRSRRYIEVSASVLCAARVEREKKTGKVPAITLRRCYQVGVARRAEPPGTIIIVMGREQHNERGPARTIAPAAARLYKTTRLNLHASLSGTGARRFEYD